MLLTRHLGQGNTELCGGWQGWHRHRRPEFARTPSRREKMRGHDGQPALSKYAHPTKMTTARITLSLLLIAKCGTGAKLLAIQAWQPRWSSVSVPATVEFNVVTDWPPLEVEKADSDYTPGLGRQVIVEH